MTIDNREIHVDAFNLLCGKKIGSGIHRDVFDCRIRDDLVVKVETEIDHRYFANVFEEKFYSDHEHYKKVSDWLAPVEFLSPDGRLLLQKRCDPIKDEEIPDMLPAWMTDIKAENFGRYEGRIVLVDYAMTIPSPSVRLKKWRGK